MSDQTVTIRRADLAPAAARIAQAIGQPLEGVEQALWAWARQGAALIVQDAYLLVLAPDGQNRDIFRGALALWLQERQVRDAHGLVEYPADADGQIFPGDLPI